MHKKNATLIAASIAMALMIAAPETEARSLKKAFKSTCKEISRAAHKVSREARNGAENIAEGAETYAKASLKIGEASIKAPINAVESMAKGDIEGSIKAVTVDHWRTNEKIAAEAVTDSSALRLVAQVGATAYAGPGGGAAFAGWYGYHASGGSWDAAAKAGALTYVSTAAMPTLSKIPGDAGFTYGTAARVAAGGGASAGLAALSGGDSAAVRDAFVLGAATAGASEIYRSTAGIEMSGKIATEGPVAKPEGVPMRSYSPDISHVGLDVQSLDVPGGGIGSWARYTFAQENGPVMQAVAKVPGMNRMAYFHDIWMQDAGITSTALKAGTIAPAAFAAYLATGVPLAQQIQDTE